MMERNFIIPQKCLYRVSNNSSDGADQSTVLCKFYAIDNDLRIYDMLHVFPGNLF